MSISTFLFISLYSPAALDWPPPYIWRVIYTYWFELAYSTFDNRLKMDFSYCKRFIRHNHNSNWNRYLHVSKDSILGFVIYGFRNNVLHFTLNDSLDKLSQSNSILPLSIVKRFERILFPILKWFVAWNLIVFCLLLNCWLKKRSSQFLLIEWSL